MTDFDWDGSMRALLAGAAPVTFGALAVFAVASTAVGCGSSKGDSDASNEESGAAPDGGAEGGAAPSASCSAWEHDGLEPACEFTPGPGTGRTEPERARLPKPTGACPGFVAGDGCREENGVLICTFTPDGEPPREVQIWVPPGGATAGPMVFYFYGLLGWPSNAVTPLAGFPPDAVKMLQAAGGMLVAPNARADRNPPRFSRLPWIDALGLEDDDGDVAVVDEVVGCAVEKGVVDVARIHVSGLSAGGWMTSRVAVKRSGYVASIANFSGGIEDLGGLQDPENTFPVAMFNGGPSDFVGAHFQNEAQSGVNLWRSLGHFAMICEHGGGHSVPVAAGTAGMRFLLDHPYGTVRSPYCDAAPPEMSFCALTSRAVNGVALAPQRTSDEAASCRAGARGAGLGGRVFSGDMLDCACSRCGAEVEACLADAACVESMRCSGEKGCFGIDCYQDHLCAAAIDAAGGPQGASSQLAVAFSDCMGAAACGLCSPEAP